MNERLVVITLHLLYNLASVYAKADARFEPIFEKIKKVYLEDRISMYELEQLVSSFENARLKFLAEKKKLTQTDDIQLAQIAAWALYIAADVYWQLADMYCQYGTLFEEYRDKFEAIRKDMWHMKNNTTDICAIVSAQVELDIERNKFIDDAIFFLDSNVGNI